MKSVLQFGLLVVIAVATPGPAAAEDNPKSFIAAELKPVVETLTVGLKKGSVDRAVAGYTESPEPRVVQSNGAGDPGIEKIRGMYTQAFKDAEFTDVQFDFLLTRLEKDRGSAHFTARIGFNTKPDGRRWEQRAQCTWQLRKVKKNWRIELEHCSPIKGVERIRPLDVPEGIEDPRPPQGPPKDVEK